MLVCPCSTRVCMDWQLSTCMKSNILQGAFDTVELIHLQLCHPTLMPSSSLSFQGQWQIGTLFLPPPEPISLLMPSIPSTNSQTFLLIVAESCHSSSNGWSPIAGYSLKNWRIEERSILLLVALAPDLPMRILSVLFSVPVDACCHKQSLMRDCLRDKRTSTLRAINYFTVENVNDTPPVIDAKPLVENRDFYWYSKSACLSLCPSVTFR